MKILLATDGSPSAQPAEALAAAIVWPEGTQIEVLCVDQLVESEVDLPRDRFAAAHAAARAEIEARLAALIERLAPRGRVVRARIVFGRPASAIVAEAGQLDSDLVIVGSHDRGPLASFALGSVAAEVVDHAPCPVLIARRPSLGPVVLGQDGSAGARQAEDLLLKWRFLLAGPVQVVSASPLVPPWYMTFDAGMSPGIDGDRIQKVVDERRAASRRDAAGSVTRLLAAGVEAKAVVRDGQPVDALLDAIAETGARLVVVGSRGNTGISRLLLGSVARSLLYRTTCSVLITREKKVAQPKPAPDLAAALA